MTLSSSHAQAARLLAARPDGLEPGLHILDQDLELAEGCRVDLLACDGLGDPLVVLFCDRDVAPAMARAAAVTAALRTGRPLLRRLYASQGLDVDRPVRFALLSPRFADEGKGLLELLGRSELSAWEYRVVRTPEGAPLLDLAIFARSPAQVVAARTSSAAASAAPSSAVSTSAEPETLPPSTPLPKLSSAPPLSGPPARRRNGANGHGHAAGASFLEAASDPSERLLERARESIRALSGDVSETAEADSHVFRVDDSSLASLRLGSNGLFLRVGDDDAEQAVDDEASFNAGLNAVFSHYFSRIAHRA